MLFSLAVIFLVGLSAAAIFQAIGLPRIIGMLATGILTALTFSICWILRYLAYPQSFGR